MKANEYLDMVVKETNRHNAEITRLELTYDVLTEYHNLKIKLENERYRDTLDDIDELYKKNKNDDEKKGAKKK